MSKKASISAPGPLSLKLSEIIRDELERSGAGQNAVAETAQMSAGQLSDVLTGKKQFTIGQLDRVCFALNLPLRDTVRKADEATMARYVAMDVQPLAD